MYPSLQWYVAMLSYSKPVKKSLALANSGGWSHSTAEQKRARQETERESIVKKRRQKKDNEAKRMREVETTSRHKGRRETVMERKRVTVRSR